MNYLKLTLLSKGQIFGNKKESQLDVIKKYGTKAAITDLCILTGSHLYKDTNYNIDEDSSLTGRTGNFYTKTYGDRYISIVNLGGYKAKDFGIDRCTGVRPVLQSSVIFSHISQSRVKGYNDTFEVEFGEYPQQAADSKIQDILNKKYKRGLNKTGKSYTFDSEKDWNCDKKFKAVTYEEYEYNGKKYIRVKANASVYSRGDKILLSNGIEYKNGDHVWVEVSPVKWLIDDETGILISKKVLVSGIRFFDEYKNRGDFERTEVKMYLDEYMVKDLFQNIKFTSFFVEDDIINDLKIDIRKNDIKSDSKQNNRKIRKRTFKNKKVKFNNPFFKEVLRVKNEISEDLPPELKEKYIQKLTAISEAYASSLIKHYDLIKKKPSYELEIMKEFISMLDSLSVEIQKANEFNDFSDDILEDSEKLEEIMNDHSLK